MKVFDHIAIIYNPKSTGDAPKLAKDLRDSVNGHFEVIQKKATLYPTNKPGHAIEIAYDIAQKYARPLLVSVSGDGGYNEVINGVMAAKKLFPAQQPVVAVMAAGNANDHKRVMRHNTPLIRLIKEAQIKQFDLISLTARAKDFEMQRYAHSYIGLGITPEVGHALNNHPKSRWNEFRLTLQTVKDFEPFILRRNGKSNKYDSIVFANINEMAKYVSLDSKNTIRDGKFEVISVKHVNKLLTFLNILKALLQGFRHVPSYDTYRFDLPEASKVQFDGEVIELPAQSQIVIKSHQVCIDSIF